MLTWLRRFLSSSVGLKVAMALTGLALVGFLVAHLAGNLTIYADENGDAFNEYAATLAGNPLIWPARIGLLVTFVLHIALGMRLSAVNKAARAEGYRVRQTMGGQTIGSGSMLITGLVVGAFLVVHVSDFSLPSILGTSTHDNLAEAVKERLASPAGFAIYYVGLIALGIHLSHAIQSAFQSLGFNHPKYTPIIKHGGLALAVLLFLGFASIPLYCVLTSGGAH